MKKHYIYTLLPTQVLVVDPALGYRKWKRVEFSPAEIRQVVENEGYTCQKKTTTTRQFMPLWQNYIYTLLPTLVLVADPALGSRKWKRVEFSLAETWQAMETGATLSFQLVVSSYTLPITRIFPLGSNNE